MRIITSSLIKKFDNFLMFWYCQSNVDFVSSNKIIWASKTSFVKVHMFKFRKIMILIALEEWLQLWIVFALPQHNAIYTSKPWYVPSYYATKTKIKREFGAARGRKLSLPWLVVGVLMLLSLTDRLTEDCFTIEK